MAGPNAAGAEVARALVRSILPAEHSAGPPEWLLPGQARSFRRVLAALDRYGGALLADPVGSGKTYVALAVAWALQRARPVACLVPATLAHQWRAVAARLGVPVDVRTHQQASRGRLPSTAGGLVLIDESHHYRNPHTRRYLCVAPWLVGRPVLLLSATPVVNQMDDLTHQLLLGVRDDALLADGVVSLRAALGSGSGLTALGHLVVEDTMHAGPRPVRTSALSVPSEAENAAAGRALGRLAGLRLSDHRPTAALVRGVLHRALASSPAALAGALKRYRNLLLHAQDAQRAGRSLTRAELRSFAGDLDDQLVLWQLSENGGGGVDLALDDLEPLGRLRAEAASAAEGEDPKADRLRHLLADGRPTVVFVTRRETVRHLRERLGPPPVAWCTGECAGLGHARAPRSAVLGWFADEEDKSGPRCLVVTDVAAEGLDLRRASRVVHYDLPWTPMRLEQREGRAVRLGSTRRHVEVMKFLAPPALDSTLKLNEHLARKAGLPSRVGLGDGGVRLWRWRSALSDRLGNGPAVSGTAIVRLSRGAGSALDDGGLLVGFELVTRHHGRVDLLASALGWLNAAGRWTEDEDAVTHALLVAAASSVRIEASPAHVREALDRLAEPIRTRLALAGSRRWIAADPDPAARRLAARLSEWVRTAAQRRDGAALARLERALAFVAGGHTAGEALLVRRLEVASQAEVARALAGAPPPTCKWDVVHVRLTGLVLFQR